MVTARFGQLANHGSFAWGVSQINQSYGWSPLLQVLLITLYALTAVLFPGCITAQQLSATTGSRSLVEAQRVVVAANGSALHLIYTHKSDHSLIDGGVSREIELFHYSSLITSGTRLGAFETMWPMGLTYWESQQELLITIRPDRWMAFNKGDGGWTSGTLPKELLGSEPLWIRDSNGHSVYYNGTGVVEVQPGGSVSPLIPSLWPKGIQEGRSWNLVGLWRTGRSSTKGPREMVMVFEWIYGDHELLVLQWDGSQLHRTRFPYVSAAGPRSNRMIQADWSDWETSDGKHGLAILTNTGDLFSIALGPGDGPAVTHVSGSLGLVRRFIPVTGADRFTVVAEQWTSGTSVLVQGLPHGVIQCIEQVTTGDIKALGAVATGRGEVLLVAANRDKGGYGIGRVRVLDGSKCIGPVMPTLQSIADP